MQIAAGGALTPIGDPPLFLGFLRGVPFFWTLSQVWYIWLPATIMILAIFWFMDSRNKAEGAEPDPDYPMVSFLGTKSFVWVTIVILWSSAGFFALWNLEPKIANLWVLVIEPLLVVIPAFLIIPLGKAIKLRRNQVGVLALAAGLRNSGFAMAREWRRIVDANRTTGADTSTVNASSRKRLR